MKNYILFALISVAVFTACKNENANYESLVDDPALLHAAMGHLSDVIVHDIFSPPVASRIYVYPSIAAYEVIRQKDGKYPSLIGQLKGLEKVPSLDPEKKVSLSLASLEAFYVVGKQLIFSEDSLKIHHESFIESLKSNGFPEEIMSNSIQYGDEVAKSILDWANKDNYKETRSYPKFTVDYEPNTWKPTPPAYMPGIEPHWRDIRPMVLDSATQFVPQGPTPFDLDKNSAFYKEMMEVYTTVLNASDEQKEIANFWDCNPFKMNQTGHVMFATKKISPGGHWIGITKIACEKTNADLASSLRAYTMCSVALFDGFISCWDEKYRSKLIRPETVINEHFDENWMPLLQTPPFPEHTSGHSVISTAAAVVLTNIFGDNFQFDDDTELQFGLPVRSFNSFREASSEAAISRLYGGIHYRPSIDFGVEQGAKVGEFILDRIKF